MQKGYSADWPKRMREGFDELYGSSGGRYPASAKSLVEVRAPERQGSTEDIGVPFAALIHPSNPKSGPYGGMSIAIFPGDDESPCLLSFVVGTNGLAPDEAILGPVMPERSRRFALGSIENMERKRFVHGPNKNLRESTSPFQTISLCSFRRTLAHSGGTEMSSTGSSFRLAIPQSKP